MYNLEILEELNTSTQPFFEILPFCLAAVSYCDPSPYLLEFCRNLSNGGHPSKHPEALYGPVGGDLSYPKHIRLIDQFGETIGKSREIDP